MSDQVEICVKQLDMTQLTQENAIKLVNQFEQVSIDKLWENLSAYVSQLRVAANTNTLETFESFIHIIYKGFYRKSEYANALRYFYWGYFAREQEELVQDASRNIKAKAISVISSKKYFTDIIFYLYTNGCSQQRDIVKYLGADKSNLSRLLRDMVNCGLIIKMSGPKYVFYELTQEGYTYFKQHNMARYSSQVTKRVPRLESEAVQIRNELIHAKLVNNSYRLICENFSYTQLCGKELFKIGTPLDLTPDLLLEVSHAPMKVEDWKINQQKIFWRGKSKFSEKEKRSAEKLFTKIDD